MSAATKHSRAPLSPTATYAAGLVLDGLRAMLAQAHGVRQADVEAVHDMRVASRRLRAVLSVFGEDFANRAGEELARRVKRVTSALGEARDLDVTIERIGRLREELAPELRSGIDGLLEHKRSHRSRADAALLRAVDRTERRALEAEFARRAGLNSLAQNGPTTAGAAAAGSNGHGPNGHAVNGNGADGGGAHAQPTSASDPELVSRAERAIAARIADLLQWERYVEDAAHVAELHALRIEAKRLRYTLEIFAPHLGARIPAAIGAVKELQTVLGDIHDADVLLPDLTRAAERSLHASGHVLPDLDGAAGLIQAARTVRDRRSALYGEFVTSWRKLRDRRFFERLLLEADPPAPGASERPRASNRRVKVG